MFGRFMGAWDLDWYGKDNDGNHIVVRGELNFGWILNGRAIRDVWQVPTDPADAARMRRFIGRPDDDGITLEGVDDEMRAHRRRGNGES